MDVPLLQGIQTDEIRVFLYRASPAMMSAVVEIAVWLQAAALLLLWAVGAYFTFEFLHHFWCARERMRREDALLALPLPPDRQLPHVLVQIPCFNDGVVIPRITAAVAAFDWPRDKLHVQFLDDSTDETPAVVEGSVAWLRDRGIDAISLRRTHRTGFKAGALQAGLAHSDAEFVALFDADFVPGSEFLRQCSKPMLADQKLAFVMATWSHLNGDANALTAAQQRILDCRSTIAWSQDLLQFTGSCGLWRRRAIDEAGGWQWDVLAEDADLGYRVQISGWHALALASVNVPGELPETLDAWQRQQVRWNRAIGEAALKVLPRIWRSDVSLASKVAVTIQLGMSLSGPLIVTAVIAGVVQLVLGYRSFALWALVGLTSLQMIGGALALAILAQCFLRGASPGPEIIRTVKAISFFVYVQLAGAVGSMIDRYRRAPIWTPTPKKGGAAGANVRPPATDL